jgi:aspartyl-tRNA(Asn)/glutamyl-tRNA(Gln) amidotransferase subunit A
MEPAPDLDGIKTEKGLDIAFYTGPANLLGIPALSVPCGFSTDGIPIGLQLMTPHYQEGLAINLANAYEAVTQWHQRRPPICA